MILKHIILNSADTSENLNNIYVRACVCVINCYEKIANIELGKN